MWQKIKNILRPFLQKYRVNKQLRSLADPIFVDGFPDTKNFGDALNVFLVRYLSGKDVFASRHLHLTPKNKERSFAVVGSVAQLGRIESIVWGSGFPFEKYKTEPFVRPKEVLAVRGPLTRDVYLSNGISCPEIYGDPALLLPLIYNPHIEKKYEYGIIPHFGDWDNKWVNKYRNKEDILIINIMIGDNYQLFVDQLKSCKKIITSSLHGLILAHAYHVPVCLVRLSVHWKLGEDFKFNDYFLSVNKPIRRFIDADKLDVQIKDLSFDTDPIYIDLKPLISSCPFILQDVKDELVKSMRNEND